MKPAVAIGLILIVLGVAALVYQSVTGALTYDTLVKAGPVVVQAERHYPVPVDAILAVVSVVGGAALMIYGWSRRGSA